MRKFSTILTLCLVLFAVAFAALANAAPAQAQSILPGEGCAIVQSRLFAGGQGAVTPGVPNNIRNSASIYGAVIGRIPANGVFNVISGPNCLQGVTWWQINYNGIVGWTAEAQNGTYYTVPYPSGQNQCGSLPPVFYAGQQGYVLPGLPNVLRSQPWRGAGSAIIGNIPAGGVFTVITGPQCGSGITWWQVNYNGAIGWTGQDGNGQYWVNPYNGQQDAVCGTLAPSLSVGQWGYVLPGLPNALRTAPAQGSGSYVVGSIPGGAHVWVLEGPACGSGMRWWRVDYNGQQGWTSEGQGSTYWVVPAGF